MKILVIYAYPNTDSYNYAIFQSLTQNFQAHHDIQVLDLYQEKFNPVLYFDQTQKRRDLQFQQETARYRNQLLWAEHLIFIFPIWWGGMPAILKGYIDRVFSKGFAYDYKGVIPVGHLQNKTAWIITTHDTPTLYVRFFQQDYGKVLKRQVLKMCGIRPVKHYSMPFLRNKNAQQRQKFLHFIQEKAQNL